MQVFPLCLVKLIFLTVYIPTKPGSCISVLMFFVLDIMNYRIQSGKAELFFLFCEKNVALGAFNGIL